MRVAMADTGILILTTGGTIDKNYFDALSEYQIVDSGIPALLKEARVALPFRLVELMRKDSLELTDADRLSVASAAREAPENRIVITHGTDTMTETAKVLGISAHTAHGYVKDVYRKLAVSSRAEAALAANRMGIV